MELVMKRADALSRTGGGIKIRAPGLWKSGMEPDGERLLAVQLEEPEVDGFKGIGNFAVRRRTKSRIQYGVISKWNTSSLVPIDSYSLMAASSALSAWT